MIVLEMKPFIHFRAIILLGVDFAFCSSSSSIIKQFQAIMYLDEKFYGNSDHSMSISHIANEYEKSCILEFTSNLLFHFLHL